MGARPLGAPSTATKPKVDATPLIATLVKIAIVVGIALFVWLRFFHSTAPTSEEIEAAFVPVVGYEYGAGDSPAANAMEGFINGFLEGEEISDFQVKELFSSGRLTGFVMIGGVEYSDDVKAEFEGGVTHEGGKLVTLGTAGKTFSAYEASQPPAYGIVWVNEQGLVYGVFTNYPSTSRAIATTLGTAAL